MSDVQLQRNVKLETVMVPAGNKTGLYYIPVGNLEHGTTWQQLKDFTSQVCEVNHVEVYPPTGGYVQVSGYENFEKAFSRLNGGILNGRSLQAGRANETNAIPVKVLKIFPSPTSPTQSQASPQQPQTTAYGVSEHGYSQTAETASVYAQNAAWQSMPAGTSGLTSPTTDYSYPASGYPYGGGAYLNTPTPASPYSYCSGPVSVLTTETYFQFPQGTVSNDYDYSEHWAGQQAAAAAAATTSYGPADPNAGMIYTQRRAIIIRDLERRGLSEEYVRQLVANHASPEVAAQIINIDIPRSNDDGATPRGHAFVVFASSEAAMRAITCLHELQISERRKLHVRATVEGVPSFDSGSNGGVPRSVKGSSSKSVSGRSSKSSSHHHHGSRKGRDKDRDNKGGGKEKGTSTASRTGPSSSSDAAEESKDMKRSIVIADGSNSSWRKPGRA